MNIGFIGLGLIGGSIAKTIRKKIPSAHMTACDISNDNLILAKSDGIIQEYGILSKDPFEQSKLFSNLFVSCDIIFLCAPVETNISYLPSLKDVLSQNTLLTDVGSVKSKISEAIISQGLSSCFIGGHPMAGSEKSGFVEASDHLIENAYYLLTTTEQTDFQKLDSFVTFIQQLGAIPLVITAAMHDYVTAAISHLPHVIAASLVNLIKASDNKDGVMKLIAAGGFKDITRIASSSPAMWEQISIANKDNISLLLSDFIQSLSKIQQQIQSEEAPMIYNFFDSAREYRNSFPDASLGPIKKQFVVYCDLIDESGAIATIATILASSAISIKNIGIIHNREFEEGALRIEFYDENSSRNAASLLTRHRYQIQIR